MNLSQLRYVVKLAELQHYTRAAKELYISQPSLTHAIKSLESELGVALFRRVGRGVELTEFGAEFCKHVRAGLSEIDRGIELAHEQEGRPTGTVRIGCIFTVQGDYLPCLLGDYQKEYGDGVRFTMSQGLTLSLLDRLEGGEFDVAFTAKAPNRPGLTFEHVISHELVVCVSKDNPLAQRAALTLPELRGQEVHCYRRGTPIAEEIADLISGLGLNMVASYEDELSLGGMLEHNPHICGLGTYTVGLRCFPDLAIIPLLDVPREFHHIYLVYRTDAPRSRAVDTFVRFTQDYVAPVGAVPHARRPNDGGGVALS